MSSGPSSLMKTSWWPTYIPVTHCTYLDKHVRSYFWWKINKKRWSSYVRNKNLFVHLSFLHELFDHTPQGLQNKNILLLSANFLNHWYISEKRSTNVCITYGIFKTSIFLAEEASRPMYAKHKYMALGPQGPKVVITFQYSPIQRTKQEMKWRICLIKKWSHQDRIFAQPLKLY